MRGKQWLRKSRQYASVYNEGRSWADSLVVMKALPNGLDLSRCGLSISRRVGKAVTRNKIRRRLREILRLSPLEPGWDIILIARPLANTDYASLKKSVAGLLGQAGLLKKAKAEKSSAPVSAKEGDLSFSL
jgi:ribonuclease P protein component